MEVILGVTVILIVHLLIFFQALTSYLQFSSSEWQVRIFRPIVHPAASFLLVSIADILHRRAVGSEFVGHQDMRATVAPHCFLEEFQG